MQFLKSCIQPNRIDLLIFVCSILVTLSIVVGLSGSLNLGQQSYPFNWFPLLLIAAVSLISIGATVAWRNHSWTKAILLFTVTIGSLGTATFCYWQSINSPLPILPFQEPDDEQIQLMKDHFWIVCKWGTLIAFLLAPVVWLLVTIVRMVPDAIRFFFRERLKVDRTKFLIGLAGFLLICGLINNIFFRNINFLDNGDFDSGWLVSSLVGTVASILGFLILIAWPSWILTGKSRWWSQALVWFVFLGLNVGFMWDYVVNYKSLLPEDWFAGISAISTAMFFLISLTALANPRDKEPATAEKAKMLPSVWALVPINLVLCVIVIPVRYDVATLINAPQTTDRWELARNARLMSNKTNGQLVVFTDSGIQYCVGKFDESVAPDVLSHLETVQPTNLFVRNFQPTVDTSYVRNLSGKVTLTGGRFTPQQLEDLLNMATGPTMVRKIDVTPSDRKAKPGNLSHLIVDEGRPGKIKELLEAFESFEGIQQILIQSAVTLEDWPAIVSASQECEIRVYGRIPDVPVDRAGPSLSNIQVFPMSYNSGQIALTENQIQLALDTDIGMITSLGDLKPQLYWDLVFAGRANMYADRANMIYSILDEFPIKSVAGKYHWAYGFNQKSEIEELFLPDAIQLSGRAFPPTLKTLSLDSGWIGNRQFFAGTITDLNYVTTIPKLERLYLPSNLIAKDLSFLSSSPSLTHLQIAAPSRAAQGGVGFDACPSIRSVTLFGKPDGTTISELAKLPNLKNLTVVDSGENLTAPSFVNKLQTAIPNAKIEILNFNEFDWQVPESFKRHRQRIRSQLRDQLLESGQVLGDKR